MSGPMRIAWVEDSPGDAELFSGLLEDEGIEHVYTRVDDERGLLAALEDFAPDVVLSDLNMPGFSGERALEIVRDHAPQVPFVFLSGAMGEDTAVLSLQRGATDYVLKQNPLRLASALGRAVQEAARLAERERVTAELVRAQRNESLALLVAGLSHDLRNVLQPLGLVAHVLRERQDAEAVAHAARVVAECAQRGNDLAHAMIRFARGQPTTASFTSLAAVLDSVRLLVGSSVPAGVAIHFPDVPRDLVVRGNDTELQQCLLNLCLNSLQAMDGRPAGSMTVTVDDAEEPGLVRIEVGDTGPGIGPEVMDRLFTPFFTTKPGGTGLGLLSCRRIVEALDGRLELRSTPGSGTCVRVFLPMHRDAVQAHAAAPSHATGPA